MLEFGIGLGWLGWECQNYLWMTRAAAKRCWDSSCHPPVQLEGWGRAQLQQGHLQAAKTGGKNPAKSPFLPLARVLCPHHNPGAFWDFPCQGSGFCSLIPGVAFIQVGVELGLERSSQKKTLEPPESLPPLKSLKICQVFQQDSAVPWPGPSHSPSQGFLPLQALWGERGISGAALSPV